MTRAMWRLEFRCLVVISLLKLSTEAITTRVEEIRLVYPPQIRSERGLDVCEKQEVCSVVHRRYWLRPVIERLCRCPTGQECPFQSNYDNQTMVLDNRSQMKFCESISKLPECTPREPAIEVTVRHTPPDRRNKKNETMVRTLVTADCQCHGRNYLKYHRTLETKTKNGTTSVSKLYRCSKLRKCVPREFCGNVRADYFSTYYSCSCPTGYMCLFHNQTQHTIQELFYEGPGYEAICFKYLQNTSRRFPDL